MADPFTDGQITHLLSLLSGGRKRPFAVKMLAGIQSGHPHLIVKGHPHADTDEVHVGMPNHFVRVGKTVENREMLGRFVCFSWRLVQTAVISNSGSARKAGVGITPPAIARICSNDPDTDLFSGHDDFSFLRLMKPT
jgi:hypothetical protein